MDIEVKDIREGDLIRGETDKPDPYSFTAMEYVADFDEHGLPERYNVTRYHLLERPGPTFEPYWGMVIGDTGCEVVKAVYLPGDTGESLPWMSSAGWRTDKWAKQKLAEGWTEIKENKND